MIGFGAIVLAGGLGTRLRSVAGDLPKPMVPVGGRPFLAHVMDHLVDGGIDTVSLAVGYRAEVIRSYFGDTYRGMRVMYSQEERQLGTGGAIAKAVAGLPFDRIAVVNGDTLFEIELKALYAFHRDAGADVTIAVRAVGDMSRYGGVILDQKQRVRGFLEKGAGGPGIVNGGTYIIERGALSRSVAREVFSFEKEILEARVEQMRVFAMRSDAYFIDIGIPEDYRRACEELA